MAKYIDADKIKGNAVFPYVGDEEKRRTFRQGFNYAMQCVAEAAAEDIAPVVHGEWVWDDAPTYFSTGAFVCNRCRCINYCIPPQRFADPYVGDGSNYCPHCGAKMERKEERR